VGCPGQDIHELDGGALVAGVVNLEDAAFGATAYVVAKFGIGSLWYPIYLPIIFYVTCILFVVIVFGAMGR
jgi:Na+/H+-dicarboxylate symporter